MQHCCCCNKAYLSAVFVCVCCSVQISLENERWIINEPLSICKWTWTESKSKVNVCNFIYMRPSNNQIDQLHVTGGRCLCWTSTTNSISGEFQVRWQQCYVFHLPANANRLDSVLCIISVFQECGRHHTLLTNVNPNEKKTNEKQRRRNPTSKTVTCPLSTHTNFI